MVGQDDELIKDLVACIWCKIVASYMCCVYVPRGGIISKRFGPRTLSCTIYTKKFWPEILFQRLANLKKLASGTEHYYSNRQMSILPSAVQCHPEYMNMLMYSYGGASLLKHPTPPPPSTSPKGKRERKKREREGRKKRERERRRRRRGKERRGGIMFFFLFSV